MDSIRPPKWPHTLNWPWSPTKHSDDSTHASPERFTNVEVVITEKLDGGNTCLFQGEVYARSVTAPSRDGWMAMVRKHHAWKLTGYPKIALNGEDLYGIHSIVYDPCREQDTFHLFAVRELLECMETATIVSWGEVEFYAALFDMATVPVLYRGSFGSVGDITGWFEQNLPHPSAIGGADREGFVIRLARSITDWEADAAKYIRPRHVQTDEHWRVNWQPCALKESE
jgi:hypothetical protein